MASIAITLAVTVVCLELEPTSLHRLHIAYASAAVPRVALCSWPKCLWANGQREQKKCGSHHFAMKKDW